ncbi:hypothetical protein BAL199_12321 [alpha proteobacterium BAL199]|nr:hypothetical protein BAL199_12321 [alpha proteobacterium BAL199]
MIEALGVRVGRRTAVGLLVLPHRFGQRLGAVLQAFHGVALRSDGVAGLGAAKRVGSVFHRPLGLTERLRDLSQTFAELAHEVAELPAQPFLHLRQSFGSDLALVGSALPAASVGALRSAVAGLTLLSGALAGPVFARLAGHLAHLLVTALALKAFLMRLVGIVHQALLLLGEFLELSHHLLGGLLLR